jgi:hypothetical protein
MSGSDAMLSELNGMGQSVTQADLGTVCDHSLGMNCDEIMKLVDPTGEQNINAETLHQLMQSPEFANVTEKAGMEKIAQHFNLGNSDFLDQGIAAGQTAAENIVTLPIAIANNETVLFSFDKVTGLVTSSHGDWSRSLEEVAAASGKQMSEATVKSILEAFGKFKPDLGGNIGK